MLDTLDISASALQAQRTRMDTIACNIASMNVTRNAAGQKVPYRRRFVVFSPGQAGDASKPGVHVSQIGLDSSGFRKVHQPSHPDADKEGNVLFPNVDLAHEYVDAMEASRAYEANVTTMEVTKAMFNSTLRIIA